MENIICEVKMNFWRYSSECMLFSEKLWEEMQFWLKIIKEMMPW